MFVKARTKMLPEAEGFDFGDLISLGGDTSTY